MIWDDLQFQNRCARMIARDTPARPLESQGFSGSDRARRVTVLARSPFQGPSWIRRVMCIMPGSAPVRTVAA